MAEDDAWVLAFMWHGLSLAVNWATNFWSSWSVRLFVLLSLAVQFALTISAGFRWRGARWVRKSIVWFMYTFGDYLATTALGKFSVSTTSGVHQLVALWVSIFLLHLAGPDNISAYSLEDNELSGRKKMELILRVVGAAYVTISISGSRKLVVAARWILFVLGVVKYGEKAEALRRANLDNLRKSVLKEGRAEDVKGSYILGLQRDDKLLQIAHSLFHICKRAMVDSMMKDDKDIEDWKTLIGLPEWKDTWKVMEMELSLMYDILYTKAAVIHTSYGYLIRVLSPIATLIALVLVELSIEAGWSRVDVWITRILLVSTVFLETVWLVSALESSWTVAYLYQRRRGWLEHAILCNRRWHRFRRWLVPLRRFVSAEGCREWSGTIGQHNMLRLCNRVMKDRLCSLAKKMGVEWCKDEHYYLTEEKAHDAKVLVFNALLELLNAGVKKAKDLWFPYSLGLLRAEKGLRALMKLKLKVIVENPEKVKEVKALKRYIRDEINEGILVWHIATNVYLYHRHRNHAEEKDAKTTQAIEVLSNYLMFLLVEHPYMLPGLVSRKLYEATRNDLAKIRGKCATVSNRTHQHDDLNRIFMNVLKNSRHAGPDLVEIKLANNSPSVVGLEGCVVLVAIKLANELLELDKSLKNSQILTLVFEVWVEMLLYVGHLCSRESHAKKLSTVRSGAELATVVWLFVEHAALYPATENGTNIRTKMEPSGPKLK